MIGYARVICPGHPIATQGDRVYLHRKVLYDKIGAGRHPCHWCGRSLLWSKKGALSGTIVSDHLDSNPENYAPDNLVPSCTQCNTQRAITQKKDAGWKPGERPYRRSVECAYCKKAFTTRTNWKGITYHAYCSKRCHGLKNWRKSLTVAQANNPKHIQPGETFKETRRGRTRTVAKICQHCHETFMARASRAPTAKYCSRRCGGLSNAYKRSVSHIQEGELATMEGKNRARAVNHECDHCSKLFLLAKRELKRDIFHYCSLSCAKKQMWIDKATERMAKALLAA